MIKKIIESLKPKTLDSFTPLHEIYDTYKGKQKEVIATLIGSIFVSLFVSGLVYQLVMILVGKQKSIYIVPCFIYGVTKTGILTILLCFSFLYGSFRVYRALRRNFRKNFKDNYLRSDKETYGGAHFQSEEELNKNFAKVKSPEETKEELFGIDENGDIRAFAYPNGLNHNKLLIGPPGSGKSSSAVKSDIYQAMYRGDSILVTDSKGDIYKETALIARAMGYLVRVLNWKAEEFKNSNGYNCMARLKKADPQLDARATSISNLIISNTQAAEGMDYWALNEFNLLKAVIMHVATNDSYIKAEKNNLPNVFKFITANGPKELQAIFTTYPKDNPIRIAYDIFADCSEQNQGQIKNGLAIRLTILTNPILQQVLSYDEIDLTLPMKRKCIYYIIISDNDDTYKFGPALFFNQIFKELCDYSDSLTPELKKKQLPVLFMLDEYRNIGGIQKLDVNIATVRSRKIYLTIIIHNKGQLETIHTEKQVETILNACVVKGLLATNDEVTAKWFSEMLGSFTALVENERYYENTANIIHARGTIQKTMGEGERPLMRPEELMNDKFNRDEIIYVISGMAPVRLNKFFAEKSGELIHPLEIKGYELGRCMPNRYKPKWRKELEDASAQKRNTAATPPTNVAPQAQPAQAVPKTYAPEMATINAAPPTDARPSSSAPLASSTAEPTAPAKRYKKETSDIPKPTPDNSNQPEPTTSTSSQNSVVVPETKNETIQSSSGYTPTVQEEIPDEKALKRMKKKQLDSEIL